MHKAVTILPEISFCIRSPLRINSLARKEFSLREFPCSLFQTCDDMTPLNLFNVIKRTLFRCESDL